MFIRYYEHAAAQGVAEAARQLGHCHFDGWADGRSLACDPVDRKAAAEWYRLAAEGGDLEGTKALAYVTGLGLGVEANRTASVELYEECSVEFPDGLPCALEGGAMQAWFTARGTLEMMGMGGAVTWVEGRVFGADGGGVGAPRN